MALRELAAGSCEARVAAVSRIVLAAGELGGDRVGERLEAALFGASADPRWEVRHALALALSEPRRLPSELLRALLDLLTRDGHPMVRRCAGEARSGLEERARRQAKLGAFELTSLGMSSTRRFVDERVRAYGIRPAPPEVAALAEEVGERYYQELAADTAHEVRHSVVPMLALIARLEERLMGSHADAGASELLSELRGKAEFLLRQVEALLAYARDGAEEWRSIALRELVSDALREGRERAASSPASSVAQVTLSVPAHLTLDACPTLLQTALVNLIANAFQALDGPGQVSVMARELPGQKVALVVRDTGRGMTPEEVTAALKPFTTTRRHAGGTGLGLPFARRVVERVHHGDLSIESASGRGTTVTASVPLRRAGEGS